MKSTDIFFAVCIFFVVAFLFGTIVFIHSAEKQEREYCFKKCVGNEESLSCQRFIHGNSCREW